MPPLAGAGAGAAPFTEPKFIAGFVVAWKLKPPPAAGAAGAAAPKLKPPATGAGAGAGADPPKLKGAAAGAAVETAGAAACPKLKACLVAASEVLLLTLLL